MNERIEKKIMAEKYACKSFNDNHENYDAHLKTYFSKRFWFLFIIFKYFLDNSKKIALIFVLLNLSYVH